ncbi:MAG: hypothetical protein V1772_07165, partial [Chloroflexota bacterium]
LPTPQPPAEIDWVVGGYADYAPSGMPDIDQTQAQWQVPGTQQWSHDGPVAAADLLWWLDSLYESDGVAPPDVSDSYALVQSYGAWDDHGTQNVPPLVAELGTRARTNLDHPGTDVDDLATGLGAYANAKGLASTLSLTLRGQPAFDWVRDETLRRHPVMLLLGFWELQPAGWRRQGGHYVAVAGVSPDGDDIAISDPFRNAAEGGSPGRVLPTWSARTTEPTGTLHNSALHVSQDAYGVVRTDAGWGLQGYVRTYQDVDNFSGLNFGPSLEPARATAYLGGEVFTLVDYALALSPRSAEVVLRVAPGASRVRVGQVFDVVLELDAGAQPVDDVYACLNYDPHALTVVDSAVNPTDDVTPGTAWLLILVNSVDNATGQISFGARGSGTAGRFAVATVRFKALATAAASALNWNLAEPRDTGAGYRGESVLGATENGSVTVEPGSVLGGQVALQGRPTPPHASWRVPVLLTLTSPGDRAPSYAYVALSNPSGVLAMPGVVAPGQYRVRLKGLHTLRNLLNKSLSSGANALDMGTLLEGDVVSDNRVNVRDASALAAAHGTSQGQAGYDPRADLNEDDTTNDADVSLLQANLGRRGDILVGAGVASLLGDEPGGDAATSAAVGPVTLKLTPATKSASVGQVISLTIVADSGSQPVDAVAAYLGYDPQALRAVDATGATATAMRPGSALRVVLANRVDGSEGWADLIACSPG